MSPKLLLSELQWKEKLTPYQYHVCRLKGTEAPFTGEYWDCNERGLYRCVGCGTDLFSSDAKFDSGTGWPSFSQPLDPANIRRETDDSLAIRRIEILCGHCDAHLGHVFEDGPPPTGLRYCVNSASLKLRKT